MSGGQIALLVVAALLALLLVPVGMTVRLETGVMRFWLRIAFLRFRLGKRSKPPKVKKPQKPPAKPKPDDKPTRDFSGLVKGTDDVSELLSLFLKLLRRVLRSFTIRKLRLTVTVGTPDAAKTALLYGRLNLVTSLALPVLYQYMRIRNDRIRYMVDFQKDKTEYALYLSVVTTPAAVLGLAAAAVWAALKYWWPRRGINQ